MMIFKYLIRLFNVSVVTFCITIFASHAVKAEPSQNENISKLLSLMKENQNQNTQALAEQFEVDLNLKKLAIVFDADKFDSDTCGTIGFLGTEIPTLYLNFNDETCAEIIVDTAVHEYEHIRILRDELFERALSAIKQGKPVTSDTLEQKSIDYIVGFQNLKEFKNGNLIITDVLASQIMSFLQFKIYTETKAYLTARLHYGKHITQPWSDSKITSTIFTHYLERIIPLKDVQTLVQIAKNSTNYDDYVSKTKQYRSQEYSLHILNK